LYIHFPILKYAGLEITWNIDREASMSIIEAPEMAYLFMPKFNYISGGTNYNFTKNEFSMNTVNFGDDFYSYEEYYLLWMKNFTEKERYIKLNITYSSSPVFWNVTTKKLTNTSTAESISLAKMK
jgi:hypothetical protein